MLPSSNLDEHRLRSCIRNIVRVTTSRRGNGHVSSWSLPRSFTSPVDHECPYIYTLPNDSQVSNIAIRIMLENIKAREDDATRLKARAIIASTALALDLEVAEASGDAGLYYCNCMIGTMI